MTHTTEMFAKAPRIKRMHVIDAGEIGGKHAARFYCERCETETGWYQCGITEAKRGLPCPECNPPNGGMVLTCPNCGHEPCPDWCNADNGTSLQEEV